jgi:uncharacterized protein (DUF983 family)
MNDTKAPDTARASVRGLCPSCGSATLFDGIARFAPRCTSCGLDLSEFNVGDGPAAFLIMGVGAVMTIMVFVIEIAFSPPIWVHALIFVPVTAVLVLASLRVAKAALLILEYRNRAREGRLVK